MALVEPLPDSIRSELFNVAGQDEATQLAVSTDIDGGGQYGERWLVVTSDHAYVFLPDGERAQMLHSVPLKDISGVTAEFLVGSGVLEVQSEGKVIDLLHYSQSLAPRFTKVARRLESISKNEELPEGDSEESRRCETCGRFLPDGTKVCPACLNKVKVLKRLLGLTRPYWGKMFLVAGLMLVSTAISLVLPYLNKPFMDNFFHPEGAYNVSWRLSIVKGAGATVAATNVLITIVLIYLAVWIISWAVAIYQGRLSAWLGSRLTLDIRVQLYQTLQRLSLNYFDKRQIGSIMSRITQDTGALNNFMNQTLQFYVVSTLCILGSCAMMFAMSWKLALWVVAPSPIVAFLSILFFKRLIRKHQRYWHTWSRIGAVLHDALSGIRVIRAFAQEEHEISRFNLRTNAVYDAEVRVVTASNTFWPTISLLTQFSTGLIWLVGGIAVIHANISPGTLVAFLAYITGFYAQLQTLCRSTDFLSNSLTATERIFEVLDTEIEVGDDSNPVHLSDIKGEIEFRNVCFGYEPINPVLKDVSIHIQPGEMIGLVGHSGAGKTTLINMICRFYDVTEGQILVDGVDVRKIAMRDLRSQIGVVLQEPFLFNGTISENISYAKRDATREQIIRAARAANAHEFILKLPDGYDSQVGERGGRLSGGERQRISIARAILCDPKILILDEATSSVDTQAESQIQQALARLVKNRTTIAIAHRLSTLRQADRLIVLQDGQIAEIGTHDELMDRHGVYWRLVEIQKELSNIKAVEG
ncbi:MAG: ABC transporter ATP-binding protein [Armatimonadota bacterium]|nr:ABC transporter ATP-binding protein/permease [bacterium]